MVTKHKVRLMTLSKWNHLPSCCMIIVVLFFTSIIDRWRGSFVFGRFRNVNYRRASDRSNIHFAIAYFLLLIVIRAFLQSYGSAVLRHPCRSAVNTGIVTSFSRWIYIREISSPVHAVSINQCYTNMMWFFFICVQKPSLSRVVLWIPLFVIVFLSAQIIATDGRN